MASADVDFDFARINLEEKRTFYAQICFHFQQSAEKYLKAYIIASRLEFRKVHDLTMLPPVETHYPIHWPTQFSQEETEKCFDVARRIQFFIKDNSLV